MDAVEIDHNNLILLCEISVSSIMETEMLGSWGSFRKQLQDCFVFFKDFFKIFGLLISPIEKNWQVSAVCCFTISWCKFFKKTLRQIPLTPWTQPIRLAEYPCSYSVLTLEIALVRTEQKQGLSWLLCCLWPSLNAVLQTTQPFFSSDFVGWNLFLFLV